MNLSKACVIKTRLDNTQIVLFSAQVQSRHKHHHGPQYEKHRGSTATRVSADPAAVEHTNTAQSAL